MLTYDMHTHILPGVDDGAKTVDESLILINRLADLGITDICLTPHYYTHKESLKSFISRRNAAFERLCSSVDLRRDVRLHLGAEVYVTKYLFSTEEDLRLVCYDGLSFMLVELPYNSTFEGESMVYLSKLISNYRITPVLAHVERYPYLLKHTGTLNELVEMGVHFQSNACSFTKFPLKLKLTRLLKNSIVQIIGSDAHSLTRNSPDAFAELNALMTKKLSGDLPDKINSTCSKILR